MPRISVNSECCKGCGLCASVCPKKIIQYDSKIINSKGYTPAQCIDMDACIGCAFCANMCPDVCITVEK